MNVLFVNSVCGIGSTGRICAELAKKYEAEGHICKIAYGRDDNIPEKYKHFGVRIGSKWDLYYHALNTRIFDNHGFCSKQATREFLKWADTFNPDMLWLHNIHGYYINVEMLFDWIKKRTQMQVKWTLHDCWAFTGHCSHFTMVKCEQWRAHCSYCCQKNSYPSSYFLDNCKENFYRKKEAFTDVKNMTIITPSQWLADLVKQSFLKGYPVKVVYNTIDTNVFKPTPSDFRERNGLVDKKIVLGVASIWNKRKGLDDFIKLACMLNDDYQIVLVGLNKKQLKKLPKNMLGIARTNSVQELAQIYTAADVFLNTTYEDNYPTVNLEARACGTPVITYNTGGSPESAGEEAVVVEQGDLGSVLKAIEYIQTKARIKGGTASLTD